MYLPQLWIWKINIDKICWKVLSKNEQEAKSVVTVMSSKGSVPRGAGAKMVVYPTGKIVGSIGGGCSEVAVIRNAINIIGSRSFRFRRLI